jgi:DNA-directed RNA polymerase subunit N (RpoN/RPB10)
MIPPKCYTCGHFLADIEIEFRELVEQMDKENLPQEERNAKQKKFLDDHHVKNICCRGIVITNVDIIKVML